MTAQYIEHVNHNDDFQGRMFSAKSTATTQMELRRRAEVATA
jgi:hypothetical protein